MPLAQLISATALHARLQEPNLVLLDCRFALEDPGYGARSHTEGHLPGAHFADLERDLSAPVVKGVTGRHPLPDPQMLMDRLRSWGIDNDSTVVLYDDGPGAFAARAWWLLAWLGKRDGVWLLDGGLKAWKAAGLALTTDAPKQRAGSFSGQADGSLLLSAVQLQQRLGASDLTLLDARALPRFRGEVEPLDPVAGHIPGALNRPFAENIGADGRFKPAAVLRAEFEALLGDRSPATVVHQCGSGVSAVPNLLAMEVAGLGSTALFAGSWSEWCSDPARPVEKG